jgi:hypothetical protein
MCGLRPTAAGRDRPRLRARAAIWSGGRSVPSVQRSIELMLGDMCI